MKLLFFLGINLLNLLSKTWIIKINGEFPKYPSVIAFWHGQMLPVWKVFAKKKSAAIVSTSKDGAILTSLLKKWGYDVARGSSSKNGSEALNILIDYAKQKHVLITPDGPKGPIRKMKAGAAVTAMRSGAPLVLIGVIIGKKKVFNRSWDKFELPLPFSKITITISSPLHIDSYLTREEINQKINECEIYMNQLYDNY